MPLARYDLLAALFAHPGPHFEVAIAQAIAAHVERGPATATALQKFQQALPADDLLGLQELHTRTFDVQPITSLDIGYTLFGEDYKRGALLAGLSREHQKAENDCGSELGDHLTNVLRLLPKLADVAIRDELVTVLLGPAVREMIREFEPARMAKKEELYKKHHKTVLAVAPGETRTAWLHALKALYELLREDFGLKDAAAVEESKFLGSVSAELGLDNGEGTCGPNPMRGA